MHLVFFAFHFTHFTGIFTSYEYPTSLCQQKDQGIHGLKPKVPQNEKTITTTYVERKPLTSEECSFDNKSSQKSKSKLKDILRQLLNIELFCFSIIK